MSFFTYILFSESLQTYYAGSTDKLEKRLYRHNTKQEKYTRKGVPWQLIWHCQFDKRSEAFRLEMRIKKRGIKRYLNDNSIR
jgi:putative endonuclease